MLIRNSLLYAGSVALGSRIFLPELTGPHKIGLTHFELIDESRVDPFVPDGSVSPRDLMATLFYPTTTDVAAGDGIQLAPQFPSPATASHIDVLLDLPNGTASRLTTRAYLDAPISRPESRPVILFSHGFGFMRGLYSALLSDLASHGWIAVSVDHPYDASIVEYPDGRVVRARDDWSWPLDPELRERMLDVRVADLLFVLEALGNASVVVGAGLPEVVRGEENGEGEDTYLKKVFFNTSRVAALGHSFGGATAVEMLLNSTAVAAAADLDGFLYGPVVRRGTRKPVLVLGFPEHFATDDPDAVAGWPSLEGWKADFTVEGTVHESFSDYPVLADVLEDALGSGGGGCGGDGMGDVGKVKGERMVRIMGTYVRTSFERFVLGIDSGSGNGGCLLEGNSSAFPEVKLRRKRDGQLDTQSVGIKFEL